MKKAKIIKGKKPRANDNFEQYEDELTLAELIQNAAARGLTSVRGGLFARPKTNEDRKAQREGHWIDVIGNKPSLVIVYPYNHDDDKIEECDIVEAKGAVIDSPPEGATCACALGAMSLTPKLTNPINLTAMRGNDTRDRRRLDSLPEYTYDDERSMQIGLAYEQALRPD